MSRIHLVDGVDHNYNMAVRSSALEKAAESFSQFVVVVRYLIGNVGTRCELVRQTPEHLTSISRSSTRTNRREL